ncbi:MAG: hypothetical protein JSR85_02790 [Proteobacteria bacterium]|nr:hypothetical protein [Pseudomonadota bacterium]
MKFRIATLLSFLSGIAFFSTPAVSMPSDEAESGKKTPSLKVKAHTTREKNSLKEFLNKQDYSGAFRSTKAALPHVSDEEIVNFLMTSNKYPGWDTVDPNDKTWVVAKITNAARAGAGRKDLVSFLSKKDFAGAFRSTKANTTASDEEIVNFLMMSNEYPGWDTVDPEDKTWVVYKITKAAKRQDLENFLSKQDYSGAFRSTKAGLPHVSDEEIVNFLMTSNEYPGWVELDPYTKGWVFTKITGKSYESEMASAPLAAPSFEILEKKTTTKKISPFPGTLNELEEKIKGLKAELKVLNVKRFPMKDGKTLSLEEREASILDTLIRGKKAALHEANAQLQIKIDEKIEENKKIFSSRVRSMNKRLKTLGLDIQEKERGIKETSDQIIIITKTMDLIEIKRNIETLKLERNTEDKLKAFEEKLGAFKVASDLVINVARMISEEIAATKLKYSSDITKNKAILSQVYNGLTTIEEERLHKYRADLENLKIGRQKIHEQILHLKADIQKEPVNFRKAQTLLNKRKEKLQGTPVKKLRVTHSTGDLLEGIQKQARERTVEEVRELEQGLKKKEGQLVRMLSEANILSIDTGRSDDSSSTEEDEDEWK